MDVTYTLSRVLGIRGWNLLVAPGRYAMFGYRHWSPTIKMGPLPVVLVRCETQEPPNIWT